MRDDIGGDSSILCYDYDEFGIRIWYRNHDVVEYTADDVGDGALKEMKRLADLGQGLSAYIAKSKNISFVVPRRWKEWL